MKVVCVKLVGAALTP
nr:hypothetical protein [Vibrio navarrensis]